MPQTIACLVADLHLTLKRPACRADKDWMDVQAGYLNQLKELAEGLPILCAGDVFDRWNVTPELIHFALEHLPDSMITIAGQHDLPNHRMDEMNRSAYGVLKRAKKIIDISESQWGDRKTFFARGFGWGQELDSNMNINDRTLPIPIWRQQSGTKQITVALVHKYCWMEGKGYPGAPEEAKYINYLDPLEGFDTLVFGDNHQPFQLRQKHQHIYNCGGFMVRRGDEIGKLRPSVGFLFDDGSVKRQYLNVDLDKYQIAIPKEEDGLDVKEFLRQLDSLGEHGLDFRDSVMQRLKKDDVSKRVKEIITKALDNEQKQ